jgi:hypothetical protein
MIRIDGGGLIVAWWRGLKNGVLSKRRDGGSF